MKNLELHDRILGCLHPDRHLSADEIICELSSSATISEREVKEALWQLIADLQIAPDQYWRLKLNHG